MEDKFSISPKISWQDIEGEVVILDGAGLKYYTVNDSAVPLWRLLANGTDRDVLVRTLIEAHGVDSGQAGPDVDAFLGQLRSRGLLDL